VISDIDDTVKITHVTDRARMLAATFLDDFAAVPGMSTLYRTWADSGASLHFVSSSPWHLYEPLAEHLQQASFPTATLSLKTIRLKDRSFLDLFRPGSRTKPPILRALIAQYPRRRFVLVGDSGEEDPEVYAGLMRAFPDRIVAVYIRNITGASADDARFRPLLNGLGSSRWRLFSDPVELPTTLP
jgi:phosphatidate phosphatase APP1